jgi:type I restriction enzyme S subunit
MSLKLGYKQTEIGVIPEDWETRRIDSFTSCTSGGTPSTLVAEYWGGPIRWMSSGELNLKRVREVDGRITEAGLHNSSTKMVPAKCVLIGLAGQGKTRGTAAMNFVELCTNQSIAAILPSKSHDSAFLYYVIDTKYEELRGLSDGGGGRGGLNLSIIKAIQVTLPGINEQEAIAEALSDVDALIDSLEALLTKKRNIKTGVMQELLTGRTRLPGFIGDWKEVRLGDIGTMRGGTGFPLRYQGGNSGIPFYKVSDMNNPGNEVVMQIANNYVSANSVKSMGAVLHEPGSIVFAKVGAAIFLERKRILSCRSCIDNNMMSVTLDSSVCDVKFVHHALQRVRFGDLVSTTALPSINGSVVAEVQIPLPLIKEQKAIANVLSDIDDEIEALEKRLAKTRDLKQGMAQELLTGRTRLV